MFTISVGSVAKSKLFNSFNEKKLKIYKINSKNTVDTSTKQQNNPNPKGQQNQTILIILFRVIVECEKEYTYMPLFKKIQVQ